MIAVIPLEAHDGRRRRPHDAQSLALIFLEPLPQFARVLQGPLQLVAAHQEIGHRGKRRVVHPFAEAHLFVAKGVVIMLGGILDGIVIGKICLQDYFARQIAPTGSSGDLGKQLEGAFGGAEIRKSERKVGAYDADQRYSVHVVTLGDHLCAHQQIEFARIKSIEHAFEVFAPPHSIAVQPAYPGTRELLIQALL